MVGHPSMNGYVTQEEVLILSQNKIYARVPSGTLWMPVENPSGIAAILLYGGMEYAVDVIRESTEGAQGRSYKGELPRYKLYIGGTDLYEQSKHVTVDVVRTHGFYSITDFYKQAEEYLEENHPDIRNSQVESRKPGEGVILWNSEDGRKCILLANNNNTGIIQDGKVNLVNDDSIVSVDGGLVMVQNSSGRNLVIDKGEILEPAELRNLGSTIKERVRKSLDNIRLKR